MIAQKPKQEQQAQAAEGAPAEAAAAAAAAGGSVKVNRSLGSPSGRRPAASYKMSAASLPPPLLRRPSDRHVHHIHQAKKDLMHRAMSIGRSLVGCDRSLRPVGRRDWPRHTTSALL